MNLIEGTNIKYKIGEELITAGEIVPVHLKSQSVI